MVHDASTRVERDCESIEEFCRRNGFSKALFYKMPSEDRPAVIRFGTRVLITKEDAAAWRARKSQPHVVRTSERRK